MAKEIAFVFITLCCATVCMARAAPSALSRQTPFATIDSAVIILNPEKTHANVTASIVCNETMKIITSWDENYDDVVDTTDVMTVDDMNCFTISDERTFIVSIVVPIRELYALNIIVYTNSGLYKQLYLRHSYITTTTQSTYEDI